MRYSELAFRYASAFFDLATEVKQNEAYLKTLKDIQALLESDVTITQFLASPLIKAEDKVAALMKAFKESQLPEGILNFILLLAKKGRLALLPEVVAAYQAREDELNGVTRGTVKSAGSLNDKQKENILNQIQAVTKKKVVLQYLEDKSLIGGLVAQVGSFTFDDSLAAHLRRIKEDLTRRIN